MREIEKLTELKAEEERIAKKKEEVEALIKRLAWEQAKASMSKHD